MKKLSICIPTYNRSNHLNNCLYSIVQCVNVELSTVQICVSDNNSTDNTLEIVESFSQYLDIKYHKNESNLGIPRNFLNVVSMAEAEFIWLVGDDDILLPDAISRLIRLIEYHPSVDFFYVNSFLLESEYLSSYPSPFDTKNLPQNMVPFSKWDKEGELPFLDLINPKISFDFLGGMFLSVFRKINWDAHTSALNKEAIFDTKTFSHFDNTFPHIKIFSEAFSKSLAYFNTYPLIVSLSGVREWAPMYPLIRSVRLPEALDTYRRNGLPFRRYLQAKNFSYGYFIPDFLKMYLNKETTGYRLIEPAQVILSAMIYPNSYLSFFYYLFRNFKRMFTVFLQGKNK